MAKFIPDLPEKAKSVPFYDDATSEDGWQGQATSKTIEVLKSELTTSITRLGGIVTTFQRGKFHVDKNVRDGYLITYNIESATGTMVPGKVEIAALPVKTDSRMSRTYEARCQKSLKMALYMLIIAFDGMWFLQQLSPGYAPLMPFMLGKDDLTISQMWTESKVFGNLLPSGDNEFIVEGEVKEL